MRQFPGRQNTSSSAPGLGARSSEGGQIPGCDTNELGSTHIGCKRAASFLDRSIEGGRRLTIMVRAALFYPHGWRKDDSSVQIGPGWEQTQCLWKYSYVPPFARLGDLGCLTGCVDLERLLSSVVPAAKHFPTDPRIMGAGGEQLKLTCVSISKQAFPGVENNCNPADCWVRTNGSGQTQSVCCLR